MKRYYLLFTALVLIFSACKKENYLFPEGISDTPIFKANGVIGEDSINIQAGVNDAKMVAEVTTVFGVKQFISRFTLPTGEFKIELADGDLGLPGTEINYVSTWPIRSYYDDMIYLDKTMLINGNQIASVNFSVNDGPQSNTLTIREPGYHAICMEITYNDGTLKRFCNTILLGHHDNAAFKIGSTSSTAWIESTLAIESIEWLFDNAHYSTATNLSFPNMEGIRTLTAKVQFENGTQAERTIIIDADNLNRGVEDITSYKYNLQADKMVDHQVKLSFTKNGQIFTPIFNAGNQPSFTVVDVKYFRTFQGKSQYKVTANYSGDLRNNVTQEVLNSNLEVIFLMELPL